MKKINVVILLGILVILFSWGAFEIYKEKKARAEIDRLMKEMNLEERVSYRDVDYSLLSGKLEITGVTVQTKEGKTLIEKITVYRNTPTDLVVSVEGIRAEGDDFGRQMKEIGIENPVLNLYIDASLNEENREVIVRRVSLSMPGAFDLSMNFHLSNISSSLLRDLASLSDQDDKELRDLSLKVARVRVNSFSVVFEDLGLRERILEADARKKKKSKDELLKEVVSNMEKTLKKAKTDFERDFIKALISFVKEGGKITLSLNPDRPLELQEVIFTFALSAQTKDVSPLVRDLKLSVRHSKKKSPATGQGLP